MDYLVVIAILAVAAVIAALVRARRRPPPEAPVGSSADLSRGRLPLPRVGPERLPGTEEGVPTFRVVALGARGSGKTMLLASMFHQAQTFSGRSYFLTAPFEQVVLLNQWFTEVADPKLDWMSGTAVGDTRELLFTVRTRSASGASHVVMHLGYLEYSGGLLTDVQAPGDTGQADLLRRIDTCDAMFGIIDGYRIRQSLDGHAEGNMRLQQSMTAMISLVMLSNTPITFVITKWDLLRDIDVDEDARLSRVRKLLMANQGFRDLVQAHSAHRVVRLIPVSAVGPDFVELDEHGMVAKVPGGQIRPTNVDIPLAAVVPDIFEQVERSMDRAALTTALDRVARSARPGPGAALAELGAFVGQAAGKALGAFSPYAGFLGDAASSLFGHGDDQLRDRQARLDRQLSETERDLEEFQLARRRVLREFQSRVDVLEGQLPSSRLSGEE